MQYEVHGLGGILYFTLDLESTGVMGLIWVLARDFLGLEWAMEDGYKLVWKCWASATLHKSMSMNTVNEMNLAKD